MDNHSVTCGVLTAQETFLYPDTPPNVLPTDITLAIAQNGKRGVQLLLKSNAKSVKAEIQNSLFHVEWFCMQPIPVEYNTGDGVSQGGGMVLETQPGQKPDYATRPAPFDVYDCLRPLPAAESAVIGVEQGLAACYFCLSPKPGTAPGRYDVRLTVQSEDVQYECTLHTTVYAVQIPLDAFPVTNWFSIEAICRFHHVQRDTEAFYAMLRKYADVMRRAHQTVFYIMPDERCVTSRAPYQFDFSYLRPILQVFFDAGMTTLEIGPVLSRGFLPGGAPDMYTDQFKCAMAPQVSFETPLGYEITVSYIRALAAFLAKNGWEHRVLFHIHDEPDIHYKTQEDLDARKRQYYLAASILRKYLPEVRIIEAVDSTAFRGGIDIWVPGTAGYEKNKAEFDAFTALGETVWNYVCCGPEGHWLNRFLDFALIKGRLLFWGFSKNRVTGFLHWGLNQFPAGMNPFEHTSCPNDTGLGTNFPCGDSFIVYPGTDGPWPSMRLEATRQGAEDAALLQMLRKKDEKAHDALVAAVFEDNSHYNDDPRNFETVYESLLQKLEEQA